MKEMPGMTIPSPDLMVLFRSKIQTQTDKYDSFSLVMCTSFSPISKELVAVLLVHFLTNPDKTVSFPSQITIFYSKRVFCRHIIILTPEFKLIYP